MKRVIRFTKIRYFMFLFSFLVISGGIIGTIHNGGFNLGIDFQAGLNQRVQVAPVGMELVYTGKGDATLDIQANILTVVVRGEHGVKKYPVNLQTTGTLGNLSKELNKIDGLKAKLETSPSASVLNLSSGLNYPLALTSDPAYLNVVNDKETGLVTINMVRSALSSLKSPQVQVVGNVKNQEFQIRVGDPDGTKKREIEQKVFSLMEKAFGKNMIVVKQSDYVGPKFSTALAKESVSLTLTALILVLIYLWFRFKLAYGVSAIAALFHDVLVMVGVIGTLKLEVNTTTIAAVLTIIGYSLNDTIVVFDRIRENTGLLRGERFSKVIDISITQSLSRTIITSLTTLLAVLALYLFGTGPIKDFSFNLIIGIVAGTYSSIFIASPILLAWTNVITAGKLKKAGDLDKLKALKSGSTDVDASGEIKTAVEIPVIERKKKRKRKK